MPENKIDEVDILNFALNLEYLEAEFYTYATTGKSITNFGVGTKGKANGDNPANGATTNGAWRTRLVSGRNAQHRSERTWFRLREPERFPPCSAHSRGHRCNRVLGRRSYAQDSRHHCGRGRPSG